MTFNTIEDFIEHANQKTRAKVVKYLNTLHEAKAAASTNTIAQDLFGLLGITDNTFAWSDKTVIRTKANHHNIESVVENLLKYTDTSAGGQQNNGVFIMFRSEDPNSGGSKYYLFSSKDEKFTFEKIVKKRSKKEVVETKQPITISSENNGLDSKTVVGVYHPTSLDALDVHELKGIEDAPNSKVYFYFAKLKDGLDPTNSSNWKKACIKPAVELTADKKTLVAEAMMASCFLAKILSSKETSASSEDVPLNVADIESIIDSIPKAIMAHPEKSEEYLSKYWKTHGYKMDGWDYEVFKSQTNDALTVLNLKEGADYHCARRDNVQFNLNCVGKQADVANTNKYKLSHVNMSALFAFAAGICGFQNNADMYNQADIVLYTDEGVKQIENALKGYVVKATKSTPGIYAAPTGTAVSGVKKLPDPVQADADYVTTLTNALNAAAETKDIILISLKKGISKATNIQQINELPGKASLIDEKHASDHIVVFGNTSIDGSKATATISGSGNQIMLKLPWKDEKGHSSSGLSSYKPYAIEMSNVSAVKVEMTDGPCTTARTGRLIGTLKLKTFAPSLKAFTDAAIEELKPVDVTNNEALQACIKKLGEDVEDEQPAEDQDYVDTPEEDGEVEDMATFATGKNLENTEDDREGTDYIDSDEPDETLDGSSLTNIDPKALDALAKGLSNKIEVPITESLTEADDDGEEMVLDDKAASTNPKTSLLSLVSALYKSEAIKGKATGVPSETIKNLVCDALVKDYEDAYYTKLSRALRVFVLTMIGVHSQDLSFNEVYRLAVRENGERSGNEAEQKAKFPAYIKLF